MSDFAKFLIGISLLGVMAALWIISDNDVRARIAANSAPKPKIMTSGPPDEHGVVCYWRADTSLFCVKVRP